MNFKMFRVTILGCSSAVAYKGRYPSSQLINVHEKLFLMDCGEGTQNRLAEHHVRTFRISHIFISHLHGDHVLGLPGLINSFALAGRTEPLHLYGPTGLDLYINSCLELTYSHTSFPIKFHILDSEQSSVCYSDETVRVLHFPLKHRIPTIGYRFQEQLQQNHSNHLDRSYCYASDNRVEISQLPYIRNANALYHETTYLQDLDEKAELTKHSTAAAVAQFAQKAEVQLLITGHYSSRYEDLNLILNECKQYFDNTILGQEGLIVDL
ncbi:MAG TPA: ribonuclease Z [Saprospiraceae bacterium]|nr:ribonuclease Z [Saprospiraceae bacterium]